MLGKRSAQESLFNCGQVFRGLVGDDSSYVYLADHRHELFSDDDFAALYCRDNGRPSIAPSPLAVALLLQWYDNRNVSDEGTDAQSLTTESAETTGAVVESVIGDGAYGTIEARLDAQEAATPYTLVAPVARPATTGLFTKEDFQFDPERSDVRCPAGQVTRTSYQRRQVKRSGRVLTYQRFCFHADQCGACPLRPQCVKETTAFRTVSFHEHEQLVRDARSFQRTDAFRESYRPRVLAEHRFARLTHFGVRQARYCGSAKVLFQLAMAAALANFTLVANACNSGLCLCFLIALALILILTSRTRMTSRALSRRESARTRLRTLRDFKTRGSQLAF